MDVSGREEVMELLEDFVTQGGGILISSHISEQIEHLAGQISVYERWTNGFN